MTRLLADFDIEYLVLFAVEVVGSNGIEVRYFSFRVSTDKSISPVQVPPVLQISVGVVVIVAGIVPLVSIAYWYVALRIVLTLAFLWASRVSARFLPGLIAIMTMAANIPSKATASNISMSVKPCWR